jgi:hypothetical protein
MALLHWPPKYHDYRREPPCLANLAKYIIISTNNVLNNDKKNKYF